MNPDTDELRPLDRTILAHIALYRMTLKEVVARLFLDNDAPRAGTTLAALQRRGYLVSEKLPGGTRYYTLTSSGASTIGSPKERGEPLGPAAIGNHLATLWFCCLAERRRHRLEPTDLRELFGADAPHHNIGHCVSDEPDGQCVFRVYEASGEPQNVVKKTIQTVREAKLKPTLRSAMESGSYRIAVLAETPEKCQHVRQLLERGDEAIEVVVRFAPSPRTFEDAIKRLRKAVTS